MVINVNKLANELKLKELDLITRPIGRMMYEKIIEKFDIIDENEVVLFNFENIKVIDSSFIDELLVKLITLSWNSEKAFFIKLTNLSEIAEINIDLVFKSYSNYNNKKIVVMTVDMCQNNSFFIGPLSNTERDIIEYLRINRSANINELAEFTGKKIQEMQDILDELYSIRLIKKGNKNIYSTV